MRKLSKLLLTLLALLCLTGCASSEKGGMGMPQKEEWRYELTTEPVSGEAKADDGRVVATYSYEKPVMTVYHADGTPYADGEDATAVWAAAAFNKYFDEWLEKRQSWFTDLAKTAREDYELVKGESYSPWDGEEHADYAYCDEVKTRFWRNDRMATVTLEQYSFTGGVHGYWMRTGLSFDMQSGKHITLWDMVQDEAAVKTAVEQELLRQADAVVAEQGEGAYFGDYANTVKGWHEREMFFDDNGMTVVFAVYDIAPYAAGEQAFLIPYELLAPYLNDYGRELLGVTAAADKNDAAEGGEAAETAEGTESAETAETAE